jgi:hypothetical protein
MLKQRNFQIVWIKNNKSIHLDLNKKPDKIVPYLGKMVNVKME